MIVYVLLIINENQENYLSVHREKELAEVHRDKYLEEEFKMFDRELFGKNIEQEMREHGFHCVIEMFEMDLF